jgi:cysteine synthase A
MNDAVAREASIAAEMPGAVTLDQVANPANPRLHRETTDVELWDDCSGNADVFVSAVGTVGTITSVGEFLKSRKPELVAHLAHIPPATDDN